jgi:hypothetical protein
MRTTSTDRAGVAAHRTFLVFLLVLTSVGALYVLGPVDGFMQFGVVLAGMWALHLALGIEVTRAAKAPRVAVGVFARMWSELREKALSRLGLADDQRSALMRTRDRAARRVAYLATTPTARNRDKRLVRELRRSNAAHDQRVMNLLLAERAVLQHAKGLADLVQPSPWIVSTLVGKLVGTAAGPDVQASIGRAVPDHPDHLPDQWPDHDPRSTAETQVFTTFYDYPAHTPTTLNGQLPNPGRPPVDQTDHDYPAVDLPDQTSLLPPLEPAHAQVNPRLANSDGYLDHDRSATSTMAGTTTPANNGPASNPTMVGVASSPTVTTPANRTTPARPWSGTTPTTTATAPTLNNDMNPADAQPDHAGRDGRAADPDHLTDALVIPVNGKTKDEIADLLSPIAKALAAEDDFLSREDVVALTGIRSRGTAGQILQLVKNRHPGHPDASGRRKPDRIRTIAHAVAQLTGRPHLNAVR